MSQITAEMQAAAGVAPARLGNGKGVHYATTGLATVGNVCGYRAIGGARFLAAGELAKMGKECTRCVASVKRMAADADEAACPAAPAVHHFEGTRQAYDAAQGDGLRDGDVLVIEPEGVVGFITGAWPVAITAEHGELHALTVSPRGVEGGRYTASADMAERIAREIGAALPAPLALLDEALAPPAETRSVRHLADYDLIRTAEGTAVHRVTITRTGDPKPLCTTDFPYDGTRNAARTLEALGWTITGMETYGGPAVFRAWVEPFRAAPPAEVPTRSVAPADLVRHDDVQVHPDGCGKWTVERGTDLLGVIWDEGVEMSRGRYATWSAWAPIAGFFWDAGPAVDCIVDAWPPSLADLAEETGMPLEVLAAAADMFHAEWREAGERIYRTAVRGALARLTFEGVAMIRQFTGAPAGRYAVAIGRDEGVWPRFHNRHRAVSLARSYGLTADAVCDSAPVTS
ncbi:hypothetical protein [Streptomyces anulatus]|uniref:hypothetical protein n=1 Tax=Streptomyces anulatus TaxID=1892 RepID=UPI003692D6CB